MKNSKTSVFDGLLADNTVLSSCMVISPVIICGDTLRNSEALAMAFTAITLLSVMIASLVYIPVRFAAQEYFPGIITRIGIYFPLLAVNSLIVVQTEAKFFRMRRMKMLPYLLIYVAGFDAVMIVTGFIRELLAYGTINNRMVDLDTLVSGLGQPFGGFIFLGLLCGLYRAIRSLFSSGRSGADVSD